jgi:hypothetical protein
VAVEVVLFGLANLTAKNSSHPGNASNVFFVAFVIGAVLLITLVVITGSRHAEDRRAEPARHVRVADGRARPALRQRANFANQEETP